MKTKEKTEAPPLRNVSDSPKVQREQAKLADVRAHLKASAAREAVLAKQVRERGRPDNVSETRTARLAQLRAGDFTSPPPMRTPVKIQLREKREEVRVLEIAVHKQVGAVRAATAVASVEICRNLEADFRGLSQSIIDRWFELIGAFDAEELFRANLRESDIGLATLPALDLSREFRIALGTPRRPNGALAGLMQSAKLHGYTIPDA